MDIKVTSLLNKKSPTTTILKSYNMNNSLRELKLKIIEEFNIKLPYTKIGISYSSSSSPNTKDKLQMSQDTRLIKHYDNFSKDSELFITDIGIQISTKFSYTLIYIIPLLLPFIYYYFLLHKRNYQIKQTQTLCLFMSTFHYGKRLIECLFIHIFSRDTMSLNDLIKKCIYYWGVYGVICGYCIWNVKYKERSLFVSVRYLFIILFFSAEIKNMKCHLLQRESKVKNKGRKGMLKGEGFELVTCANYFWEILSWLCFSVFVFHWSVFVFMVIGFYQMRVKAVKNHLEMIRKYGKKYPSQRRILIPYFF